MQGFKVAGLKRSNRSNTGSLRRNSPANDEIPAFSKGILGGKGVYRRWAF